MLGAERYALQKKDNCTVIYDNMWYVLPSFVWLSCHPCTQPEDSILNRRVSNDSMTKIMWQPKQERLPVDAAMNNAPCQQTEALCLSFATLRVRPNHKISLPPIHYFLKVVSQKCHALLLWESQCYICTLPMLNARVTKHLFAFRFALWLSRQTDCVHVCVHGGLCVWICSHPKECTGFVGLCVHTWTNCHVPLRGCLCKCVNVVVCLHCTSLELSCSFINTRVNQQLTAAVFGAERTWALI